MSASEQRGWTVMDELEALKYEAIREIEREQWAVLARQVWLMNALLTAQVAGEAALEAELARRLLPYFKAMYLLQKATVRSPGTGRTDHPE